MALIVEDGHIIPDADSYVTLTEAREIAARYGWTLPTDDTAAEVSLRKAYLYLDSLNSELAGEKTEPLEQTGAFPRKGAKCGYSIIPANGIRWEVKQAQVRAAQTYGQGVNVMPDFDGKKVASEEVTGAVVVSYFKSGAMDGQVRIKEVDSLLGCYLASNFGKSSFRTVFR